MFLTISIKMDSDFTYASNIDTKYKSNFSLNLVGNYLWIKNVKLQ